MNAQTIEITESIQNYLTVALEVGVLDAASIYTVSAQFGTDWTSLINEVNEWAYSDRHWKPEAHKAVTKAAEAYWKEIYN